MADSDDLALTKAFWAVAEETRRQADENLLPDSTKMILLNVLRTVYEQADPSNDWDLDIG